MLIQGISQTLRGWAGYHRHGVSKAVFSAVDSHAWDRVVILAAPAAPAATSAAIAKAVTATACTT